jgi:Tfp pilus assembly protein PilE
MKIIVIMISLAVVILVVVGYDLLMKMARKENEKALPDEIVKATEEYLAKQNKQVIETIKTKINETELTNSEQPKNQNQK